MNFIDYTSVKRRPLCRYSSLADQGHRVLVKHFCETHIFITSQTNLTAAAAKPCTQMDSQKI